MILLNMIYGSSKDDTAEWNGSTNSPSSNGQRVKVEVRMNHMEGRVVSPTDLKAV
jgi:hypothetical protein